MPASFDPLQNFALRDIKGFDLRTAVESAAEMLKYGKTNYWGTYRERNKNVPILPLVVGEGKIGIQAESPDHILALNALGKVVSANVGSIEWSEPKSRALNHPHQLDSLSAYALDSQLMDKAGYGFSHVSAIVEPTRYGAPSMMVVYKGPDEQYWVAKNEVTLAQRSANGSKVGLSFDLDMDAYVLTYKAHGAKQSNSHLLGREWSKASLRLSEIAPSVDFTDSRKTNLETPLRILDEIHHQSPTLGEIEASVDYADSVLDDYSLEAAMAAALEIHKSYSGLEFEQDSIGRYWQQGAQRLVRDFLSGRLPYTSVGVVCEMLHSSIGGLNQTARSARNIENADFENRFSVAG